MADRTIANPTGVYGQTPSPWQQTAPVRAASNITGPGVVAFASTTGTVALAATDSTASLCRGIAVESQTAGQSFNMVVRGDPGVAIPVDGTVAQGAVLKRSTTTAGRLAATATPAAGEAFAVALAASSANACRVWVL